LTACLIIGKTAHLPVVHRCLRQDISLKCHPTFYENRNHHWTAK